MKETRYHLISNGGNGTLITLVQGFKQVRVSLVCQLLLTKKMCLHLKKGSCVCVCVWYVVCEILTLISFSQTFTVLFKCANPQGF